LSGFLAFVVVLIRGDALAIAIVDLRPAGRRICFKIPEVSPRRISAKTSEIMDLGVKFLNHREKI
jgi:hypothetical protein